MGTKQLKNGAVTGKKVKDRSLTGADIQAGTLGRVPFAASAGHASSAGSAPPSGAAGGDLSGNYPNPVLAASEALHKVGTPSEPAFQNSWQNGTSSVGFYKDREGIVHLEGDAFGGVINTVIFQLPPGYRPNSGEFHDFAVGCQCNTLDSHMDTAGVEAGDVRIDGSGFNAFADGSVSPFGGNTGIAHVSLDGITFRAGS